MTWAQLAACPRHQCSVAYDGGLWKAFIWNVYGVEWTALGLSKHIATQRALALRRNTPQSESEAPGE